MLKVEDVFTTDVGVSLKARRKLEEERQRKLMVIAEDFKVKQGYREAIKLRGFKSLKEAKIYYFVTLLGTILEEQAKHAQSGANLQS